MHPTLLWFRQDLRLKDNAALAAALARGAPIVPIYILDDAGEGRWAMGGASRWWLHHSLAALDAELRERGSRLTFARGESGKVLRDVAAATGAEAVYWNRRYEPAVIARDKELKAAFAAAGLEVKSFTGALLREPYAVQNKSGAPFQVFTPYWRHCLTLPEPQVVDVPTGTIPAPAKGPRSLTLDELELLPRIPWAAGLGETWSPGEAGAAKRLRHFVTRALERYSETRNLPDRDGTSMLSPWLHFGELSPRQIWAAVRAQAKSGGAFPPNEGAAAFLGEVGWREFAHHLLFHFPHTPEAPLRADFQRFPWAADPGGKKLSAWQRGLTGYPIVDAGMRQLWRTGWMHNRVRMIAASFLVKHLRLSWTHGAGWFWDTLVDADLANNTLGWQWSAGSGADAAPYFRIFAPVLQGEKFDAEGTYVRRWVPELARLPSEHIHAPWNAPRQILTDAGVTLGQTYPHPIVDHATARAEALAAFKSLRGAGVVER
jgi:deoxyribodipyrimidine photo-lyase